MLTRIGGKRDIAISHDHWFSERFGGKLWEIADARLVKQGERLLEET